MESENDPAQPWYIQCDETGCNAVGYYMLGARPDEGDDHPRFCPVCGAPAANVSPAEEMEFTVGDI